MMDECAPWLSVEKPLEPFSLHLYSLSSSPKSYRSNVSSRKPVRSKPASTRLWGTTCWRTPQSRTTRPCWSDWRMSRPVSWPSWLSSMTTPSMTCCPNRLWVRQGNVVPFTHAPHHHCCANPGGRPRSPTHLPAHQQASLLVPQCQSPQPRVPSSLPADVHLLHLPTQQNQQH